MGSEEITFITDIMVMKMSLGGRLAPRGLYMGVQLKRPMGMARFVGIGRVWGIMGLGDGERVLEEGSSRGRVM